MEILTDFKGKKYIIIDGRAELNYLKNNNVRLFKPIQGLKRKFYVYLPLAVVADDEENFKLYKKVIKKYSPAPQKAKKILGDGEKKEKWAQRLAKLTDILLEEALEIAQEKEDYHFVKIGELQDKQDERVSRERDKLIRKLQRENPLRYIKNKEHAYAILAASDRHSNTNYEMLLQEGKELRKEGEIDDAKAFARANYRK